MRNAHRPRRGRRLHKRHLSVKQLGRKNKAMLREAWL